MTGDIKAIAKAFSDGFTACMINSKDMRKVEAALDDNGKWIDDINITIHHNEKLILSLVKEFEFENSFPKFDLGKEFSKLEKNFFKDIDLKRPKLPYKLKNFLEDSTLNGNDPNTDPNGPNHGG